MTDMNTLELLCDVEFEAHSCFDENVMAASAGDAAA